MNPNEQIQKLQKELVKPKRKSTVICIDPTTHEDLRKYCDEHGFKIGFIATEAVRRHLGRIKQQQGADNQN